MARDRDRPTMQDIADKVGVSKALVSLVFRNASGPSAETRQRVFAAADELGYRVNRTAALMTARRTHHLGVTINIRNSFHTEIAENIVAAADRAGYEVVLGAVTPTHGETQGYRHAARLPLRGNPSGSDPSCRTTPWPRSVSRCRR